MQALLICCGVNCKSLKPQLLAGTDDPDSNFATIGHQNLAESWLGSIVCCCCCLAPAGPAANPCSGLCAGPLLRGLTAPLQEGGSVPISVRLPSNASSCQHRGLQALVHLQEVTLDMRGNEETG